MAFIARHDWIGKDQYSTLKKVQYQTDLQPQNGIY
jgi:hypothetical protein